MSADAHSDIYNQFNSTKSNPLSIGGGDLST